MNLSQFQEPIRHGRGPHAGPAQARDYGGEIVSPVEAVFELGEVARDMLAVDGAVGANNGGLDIAERGVDPLEGRMRAAAGPVPVLMAWWLHPASVALPKHWSPSLTTVQPGSRLRLANAEIALLQKVVTRRSFKRTGLPSGVVSTAATNGVFPGAPRPRLPPDRSPPR